MIWRLTYCNKEGVEARLDIIKGASTPVEVIEGTATPFILNYKMDKSDKSGHIMSSSADISIFETPTFNIDNLKTSSETEIKVEHYINNVLDWSGFVIPDFFSKTIGTPSTVEMVASDRIGTLKGVTLDDLNQYESMRDLAVACLAKTGLTLPLYTMADFVNNSQPNAFFKALGLAGRLSDTKGRNISCYDILKSILVASNSKLVQQSGAWYIVNKFQHEQGSGNLFSTLTASTAYSEQTVDFSDVHVGARRTIIPVGATTGVFHEFGGGRSYPDNFDFADGLSGWTTAGTFVATIDNREITGYDFGPIGATTRFGDPTDKNYLLNKNVFNVANYIQSADIDVPYDTGRIEVVLDINAIGPRMSQAIAAANLRVSVGATSGSQTLWLNTSGLFQSGSVIIHNLYFSRGVGNLETANFSVKGVLEQPSGYNVFVRIYGSNEAALDLRETAVNFATISFNNTIESPKGLIYRRNQGTGFTKEHDIDTSIFGDYMRKGLDGYFYEYRIDDTSSLYSTAGTLTEPLWTAHGDTEQLPLLRHVTRQKSRMFSVAHNMISARVDVDTFKPLSIFVDCNSVNPRHVVVSASYDFLRSEVEVELEQIAYATLDVREYIYSYFGEGESGISSVAGIAGGGTGGGSGMTADQVAILSEVQVLAHDHGNKEVLDQVTQDVVDNALREMIISTDTETELTDENYLSSLRVLKEILDNNEYLRTQFLSKVNPDTAQEIIKFVKGIEIGTFTTGPLGAGASLKMENGVSRMEVDQLDVRMRATFRELIIESLKHIGGQLILSPARMKCTSVVDGGTYYKCYFDTGDGKVSNEFVAGDQARCQVFTGSGVKMYWRLVTSVGTDWINLSKTDAISGSSIPEAGDDIVQLGNRTDTTRQNAQILSTVGSDAPSWKQYKGINAFSLEGKDTTVFSGTGNKIDGKTVFMSSGANVEDGINSKNSNYSSQPTSYKANDTWTLSSNTTVNGIAYKSGEILTATQDSTTYNQAHWVKKVRYTDDTAVNNLEIGGRNLFSNLNTVIGQSGLLTYSKQVEINGFYGAGDNNNYVNYVRLSDVITSNGFYTVSFEMRGTQSTVVGLYVSIAGVKSATRFLTNNSNTYNERKYYTVEVTDYTINSHVDFHLQYAYFYIKDIKVEKGNKPTDWSPAPEDVQAAIDAAVVKATYWSVKASAPVIYKDAINAATSGAHTPVTVSGELRSGTTTTSGGFITVTPNGGTEAGTATASPVTIAPANGDGKTSYTVRLYDTAAKTTLLDTMTIPVVFKGASGVNAINVVLSNEADVLPASTDGTVSDYSGSGTIIRVFEGATELDYDGIGTANGKFNVTASATGITAGSKSESGLTCVFANASNMTADNATITFTISGKTANGASFSFTKTQSFAKSRTGVKGDTGASAPLLYLSASAQVMKCNPDNTPQTGQTISIEAKLQNVSGTATFVATPYNDAGTAQTTLTLGGTGNTRTLTNSQWLAAYKRIEVVATLGSLTDKVTIYRVADGATGATGQNAIVGLLTNESVTLQANSAGVVSSFTPANGEFWVYNGVTKVTSGITFSKVSETGCTAAITSAGVYSVSAMSADNATVVLRAVYGGVTIDKVLTLSKSRAGADGVSITGVDVEFAKNTTPGTAPTTGWTTTAQTLAEGEQLWTRTKTTYSSGNPTYSTPANITPKKGDTGTSISAVVEEYYLSTLNTTQTGGSWSETPPTWVQGKYIWSRVKITYTNPSSTATTTPYLSPEWDAINNTKLTAEQAQLAADGYMRARYVRDWTKGNTSNNLNQWSEIKIFNKAGINIALGKIPETNGVWNPIRPASNVTDNNIDSNGATNETTPIVEHYAKIDLGQIYYDIDYIQVWHPYTDGRTYYGTKTEISTDGVNWTPVFDSAKSGTYKETALGNIISFRPNEVLAKVLKGAAVTDTFKTTINGGLISTVITEYRELNSEQVTGLISGIQGANKNLPFIVAGGTYAEGIAGTAKSIDRHDGSGHRAGGKLSWDAVGNLTVEGTVNATDGEFTGMVKGNAGYFEGLVRIPFVETYNQTAWWGDESGFHPIITNPATASTNIIARNNPGTGRTTVKLPTVINGYKIAVFNGETADNGSINSWGKIEISAGTKQILNANYGFTTDVVDQYNDQPGTINVLTGRTAPTAAYSMVIDFGEYVELVGVGTIGWIVTNRLKAR